MLKLCFLLLGISQLVGPPPNTILVQHSCIKICESGGGCMTSLKFKLPREQDPRINVLS